jgi:hypothetical protein
MYRQKIGLDDEKIHRQYIMSHDSYRPGERRNHYDPDWQAPESKGSDELNRLNNEGNNVKELLYWKEERDRFVILTQRIENQTVNFPSCQIPRDPSAGARESA